MMMIILARKNYAICVSFCSCICFKRFFVFVSHKSSSRRVKKPFGITRIHWKAKLEKLSRWENVPFILLGKKGKFVKRRWRQDSPRKVKSLGEKTLRKNSSKNYFWFVVAKLVWTLMASRCFWVTFKVLTMFPNRFCPRDKTRLLSSHFLSTLAKHRPYQISPRRFSVKIFQTKFLPPSDKFKLNELEINGYFWKTNAVCQIHLWHFTTLDFPSDFKRFFAKFCHIRSEVLGLVR